jgi:hypothetical protein
MAHSMMIHQSNAKETMTKLEIQIKPMSHLSWTMPTDSKIGFLLICKKYIKVVHKCNKTEQYFPRSPRAIQVSTDSQHYYKLVRYLNSLIKPMQLTFKNEFHVFTSVLSLDR